MASPAPCLLVLRRQVDERYPGRNKASDGIMGDPAHQARKSDHNLGDAIDFTHDPAHGFDAGALAESLRRQMAGYPAGRVTYIIWRYRIASPINGWQWRSYGGDNPHTKHCHISIAHSQRASTRPWRLD